MSISVSNSNLNLNLYIEKMIKEGEDLINQPSVVTILDMT